MYRFIENKDYNKPSQQRTGTPPYMASELLMGVSPLHLYRHDVESIFYVILLFCGRHNFGRIINQGKEPRRRCVVMRKTENLPYDEWFDTCNYSGLGTSKRTFLSMIFDIQLSPPFWDFHPWLEEVQHQLSQGFERQTQYNRGEYNPSPNRKYDDETLGGHFSYSS